MSWGVDVLLRRLVEELLCASCWTTAPAMGVEVME